LSALVLRQSPLLRLGKLVAGLDILDALGKLEAVRDIPVVLRRPVVVLRRPAVGLRRPAVDLRRAGVGRLELGTAGRGKAEVDSQTHSLLEG
jgi:hypothetical protein